MSRPGLGRHRVLQEKGTSSSGAIAGVTAAGGCDATDDAIEELAIEMTEQDMLSFDFDVKTMESNPMRKMEEEEEEAATAEESSSSSGGGGAVASQQGTINPVMEENVLDILYDAAGRRYSHNKSTGETKWMDDDD